MTPSEEADAVDAMDFERLFHDVKRLTFGPKNKDEPHPEVWVTLHDGRSAYAEMWADETLGQVIVRALKAAREERARGE